MKSVNTKILGSAIKEIRKQKGLSQRELARIAKMNHVYIYKIEKGETSLTIRTLQKIADALDVELTATIAMKSLTKEEVMIEDETLIKNIISCAAKIRDAEKREAIMESLRTAIPTELVTYALDAWTDKLNLNWLPLYALRYDVAVNSYRLFETKESAPVEVKEGYLAVRIEQPPPHNRFAKNDIVVFKHLHEVPIAVPDETVLIKIQEHEVPARKAPAAKAYLGTYRDFISICANENIEIYRIVYIIPS